MAVDATSRRKADGKAAEQTLSGEPVRELYTAADLETGSHPPGGPEDRIGRPGEYPFTRGIYKSMYRGRLWTMRQFAGFGTSEETNERFHYLLEHGQTPITHARWARSGARAWRSTRSRTCGRCSAGSTSGR
jgi:methylmalonyl-CoA mutase N-terminal domain/subunit